MALTKIDDRGLKTPIDLLDNEKIRFGTGNDLELYHDGSHSHLVNSTGNLRILADGAGDLVLTAKAGEEAINCAQDGAVELMYDNSKKLQTQSGGVRVFGDLENHNDDFVAKDNCKFTAGNSADLQIYHDGSNSYILNTTGELQLRDESRIKLRTDQFVLNNHANDEGIIYAAANGNVELYYDGSKKFETTSTGVNVTGHLDLNSDTGRLKLGAGDDLSLYHDGSNSYIVNAGGSLRIQSKVAQYAIEAVPDGAVDIYHNGSKKFETITEGTKITGQLGINMTPDTAASSSYVLQLNSGQSQCCLSLGNTNTGTGVNNGLILSNDGSHAYLYNRENTSLLFGVNDDTKFKMETNGNFEIVNGDLKVASGHGIDFSATSDATGKTSELLDDYEEGTFTPAYITPGNANTTFSFAQQYGYYTKIGQIVTVNIYIQGYVASNSGSTGNDYLRVGGLPFAPAAVPSGNVRHSPSFAIGTLYKIEADNVYAHTYGGETSIRLFVHTNGGTGTPLYSNQANQNTTEIFLTGTYMV